ncbi:MAG: hypothetical protein IJ840_01030 [Bacteroidales bacterium]|nr:hypothetical protein [Bacteroidales bacterium]
MRLQKLFLTLFAAAALFVGCKEDEPEPSIPSLAVGQTELAFEQDGGTATLTVTSNRAWSISSDADWLAFNPSQGAASDTPVSVTVTALSNSSNDRTSSFRVKTDFDYRTVSVSQKGSKGEDPNVTPSGSGTAADPYNVAAVLERGKALVAYNNGDSNTSDNSFTAYTKGKVVSVEIDPSYGNATYFISYDGTAATQLQVYRGKYLEGTSFNSTDLLKPGDEVVVYGTVVNFKGNEVEYTSGSSLISVNGETKPQEVDYTKFEMTTVASFIDKAAKGQYFRLKGKVSRFSSQYCSFDLTDDSGTIYVYSVSNKDEWSTKISNGGTVELAGVYDYYEKNSQHEVVNAQILSFEGGSGGGEMGETKGSGTLEDPYNPAAAAAAVKNLTWTANDNYQTTDPVYVKGVISRIEQAYSESGTYGNASFFISEDGQASGEFQVFRAKYLGNVAYKSGQTDIKVGDEVVIYGKLMNYRNNTPETDANNAYLYSLNGEVGEGGGEEVKDPIDITVAELFPPMESDTQPYRITGVVNNITNTTFGNFDITDKTGTIYVYGLVAKDLGGFAANKANDKSFSTIGVRDRDEITIIGYFQTYTNNDGETIYELVGSYYVSGATGTGQEDPGNEDPGELQEVKTVSIAEFLSADDSQTQPYKLTGAVSDISNTSYGNFYLSDETGKVYVYGLVAKDLGSFAANKANDKSFSTIGIKDGDVITIIGFRQTYVHLNDDDLDEVVGSYYVSGATGLGEDPGSEVSGNTETIDFSSKGYANAQDISSVKGTYVTVAFNKGSNNNTPKYYNTGTAIRVYGGGYFTVTSDKTITAIKLTFGSGDGSNDLTADKGSLSGGSWTGSATSVRFSVGGTTGHRRIKTIAVTFAE